MTPHLGIILFTLLVLSACGDSDFMSDSSEQHGMQSSQSSIKSEYSGAPDLNAGSSAIVVTNVTDDNPASDLAWEVRGELGPAGFRISELARTQISKRNRHSVGRYSIVFTYGDGHEHIEYLNIDSAQEIAYGFSVVAPGELRPVEIKLYDKSLLLHKKIIGELHAYREEIPE